jgi:type IV secretory pathway ATPase VirB11/archaellum biosynthesis ATPase
MNINKYLIKSITYCINSNYTVRSIDNLHEIQWTDMVCAQVYPQTHQSKGVKELNQALRKYAECSITVLAKTVTLSGFVN